TPAISVLSAVEGLHVATTRFDRFVLPLACVVLVALFAIQRRGTAGIGRVFGPIMLLWFLVIAGLGVAAIAKHPSVFVPVNPIEGVRFFLENRIRGFVVLGSVVLCVTGAEALYADMGHFGPLPIRVAWYALVLPALVLNYFGQGAVLLQDPGAVVNPFFSL